MRTGEQYHADAEEAWLTLKAAELELSAASDDYRAHYLPRSDGSLPPIDGPAEYSAWAYARSAFRAYTAAGEECESAQR